MQKEREFYEMVIGNKKMMYKLSRKIDATSKDPQRCKIDFCVDHDKSSVHRFGKRAVAFATFQ
jgi:hypothetical protein